jgi:3-deoxy-D-manno-octulosonic-acid transferase
MYIYFLLIRIAAFFGHKKARLLVEGQKELKAGSQRLKAYKGAIWFHAASVGEFEQARPLIERLKANGDKRKIVVTFFSPSGYEMRKSYPHADGIYYLPFATRRNARRFLDVLQPSMAVFVKYEFWPAYLRELKKRNIPTYSICAIFRPTQRFFRWWGKGSLSLLKCFTHIYVQDEASMNLLTSHGVSACSVAGDTRFDRMAEVRSQQASRSAQLAEKLTPIARFTEGAGQVIVAGSTWPEDEDLLYAYMEQMRTASEFTPTKLILVPHELDPKHLHYIFELFRGRFVRYSAVSTQAADTQTNILRRAQVLVVDTMGLLSSIYTFGHAAYIGGGFGEGIHNTIEAAAYGMPVIFGPNYHHFREAEGLIAAGAARSIQNYAELEDALTTALAQHETIGAKAAAYVQSELGTTDKIYKEIF